MWFASDITYDAMRKSTSDGRASSHIRRGRAAITARLVMMDVGVFVCCFVLLLSVSVIVFDGEEKKQAEKERKPFNYKGGEGFTALAALAWASSLGWTGRNFNQFH